MAILFLLGSAHAQIPGDAGSTLRGELEKASAEARAAARADDFDAFMLHYEPPKGQALEKERWPQARTAVLAELSRPLAAQFVGTTRKGWWAGYFFREPIGGAVRVTMHRFHMGEAGWRVQGVGARRDVAEGPTEEGTEARVRQAIAEYPPFRLPD